MKPKTIKIEYPNKGLIEVVILKDGEPIIFYVDAEEAKKADDKLIHEMFSKALKEV